MTKEDEALLLLDRVKSQLHDLFDVDSLETLTPEELVILATELTVGLPVHTATTSQPVGVVDRERAWFVVGDDLQVPLFGESYEDTDS